MKLVESNMPGNMRHTVGRYRDARGRWITVCNLYQNDTDAYMVGHGVSVCGNHDKFNPEMGRHVAIGRAMKAAGLREH